MIFKMYNKFKPLSLITLTVFCLFTIVGCSDNEEKKPPGFSTPAENESYISNDQTTPDPDYAADPEKIDVSEAEYCDILQSTKCLYPFPSNHFTVPDPGTDTGLRINLSRISMPQNILGKQIESY